MRGKAYFIKVVMDLVSEALTALDDERSAQEVVCRGIGELFHASCSAYLDIDVVYQKSHIVCWPHCWDIAAIVGISNETPTHPLDAYQGHRDLKPMNISEPVTGQVTLHSGACFHELQALAGCTHVAEFPLARTRETWRAVALARSAEFTSTDLGLLRIAQRPLVALDRHMQNVEWLRLSRSQPTPANPPQHRSVAEGHGLTRRELEVLKLLSHGLLARSIAARLNLSPRTVHKHLGNVYQKLETHDRLVAVTRAREIGILPAISSVPADGPEYAGWLLAMPPRKGPRTGLIADGSWFDTKLVELTAARSYRTGGRQPCIGPARATMTAAACQRQTSCTSQNPASRRATA